MMGKKSNVSCSPIELQDFTIMKPTLNLQSTNCQAYLLRMWRDNPQEPWRASVKMVADGQEIHFLSPEKLFLFLHQEMITSNNEGENDVKTI